LTAISAIVTSGSRDSGMLSLMGRIGRAYPGQQAVTNNLMINFMCMKTRMKISKGGQISIPAQIRHRWGTSAIALEDHGDRIVVEPMPDDPIAAAEGALAEEFGGIDLGRLRRAAREDEQAAEARRVRQ
jgi:bifunctional DNA-binding transcriptional regulator/antitoxin component of YhaV-PrlF toxin-antitoxin module